MALARPAPDSDVPRSNWLAALLIPLAGVLVFANSFHVPFVFDDELSIPGNPTLTSITRAWSPPAGNGLTVGGRPLLNVSFALNHAVSGTAVWSYHLTNVLIHVAAALLLYAIVRRTLALSTDPERARRRARPLALAAALLWAIHPLQVESVTYTVQRAESLCGLFVLAALYCFVRGAAPNERSSGRWYAGVLLCTGAGVATKEVAAVIPLLVALYDRAFVAPSWREAWRRRRGLYLGFAIPAAFLAALVASTGGRGSTFDFSVAGWWRYDVTQFIAVVRYVRLVLWPNPLVIDYGTFWVTHARQVAIDALIVIALGAAAALAWVRAPRLGFLGVWFFVTLAPSSLPPGTIQMIVEHRMYLALAAPAVGMVLVANELLGRRVLLAGGLALVALGALTARRNGDYATPRRLFEDTVAKRPQNARAMALLADYNRREGRLADARHWLEESLRVDPSVAAVWNNLGDVWQELREPAKAVACFQHALQLDPDNPSTLNNLGAALVVAGQATDGIARIQAALKLAPDSKRAMENLANALAETGRLDEAAAAFERLLRRYPDDVDAHGNYADVLISLHRPAEAAAELRAAIRLRPEEGDFHNRLGIVLGRGGAVREALAEFQEAVRLNPADASARENLAIARRRLMPAR